LVARKVLALENYITMFHIESMNKIILVTGSVVGIAYLTEFFIAYYSGSEYEQYTFINRFLGPYWWAGLLMYGCNVLMTQLMWFKSIRTNIALSWILSIIVNIGMWFERFVIIVSSLYRDFLPSSWVYYSPRWTELGFYIGTFGLFFTCFLLFAKFFPVIAIHEIKFTLKTSGDNYKRAMQDLTEKMPDEFLLAAEEAHVH